MNKDGCVVENINEDCYSAHHGQLDCNLNAYNKNGKVIGYINYSIYDKAVYINMIETNQNCRRKKVGTKLMDKLRKLFPYEKMYTGFSTKEGTAFLKAYKKLFTNQH